MNSEPCESAELAIDPFTGELIDPTNADHLIDALERAKKKQEAVGLWRSLIEEELVKLARHEAKTERVCGEHRQVVIEFPGVDFDQATLKRLWEVKPELAKQYLRIERVGVQAREYDKLRRMNGPDELGTFRRELMSAERPSGSKPKIRIEK